MWPQTCCSADEPLSRMCTGSVGSASAAMSMSTALLALATASAEGRSLGRGSPSSAASAAEISDTVTPAGTVVSQVRCASEATPSSKPRSRLSGVNRHTSSRPVGTGWSPRSYDGTGCRWLSTVSTAVATFGISVSVTYFAFSLLQLAEQSRIGSRRGQWRVSAPPATQPAAGTASPIGRRGWAWPPARNEPSTTALGTPQARLRRAQPVPAGIGGELLVGGAQRRQPTAPSICISMSRLSSSAYSIGNSRAIGSMNPRTIIAIASSSRIPRLIR